jgi:ABC-2 type transport system ATP-binding protein
MRWSSRHRVAVVLNATGIEKSYGEIKALRGASLRVEAGTIVSLLGRNGAGKSTLLSVIAGLTRPDAGTITIDGIDVLKHPAKASGLVGIAPQNTGIYPPLTVRENLEFFGELSGLKRADRRKRATDVAEQLGVSSLLDRKASNLSGGEARRLHTGCALVHRPKLLMLDEPTVGADVATRVQLIDAVKSLASEGAAVVYTTHYLPEVENLGASIVIIDNGVVLASGTKDELMAQHQMQGVEFSCTVELPSTLSAELGATTTAPKTYRILGDLTLRTLIDRLGDQASLLVSVETLKPDLESVFLSVTGNSLIENSESNESSESSDSKESNSPETTAKADR